MNEKHKLMKPKDPARIGRQASQRAKKWQSRLSAALLCALLFTVFFPSCRDEDFAPSMYSRAENSPSTASVGSSSGLVQNSDGTWTATRRVPLVGAGRVLNNISPDLVGVAAWQQQSVYITDLDLDNEFLSGSALVGAQLVGNQIVSVLDMGHVYAKGQRFGFVIDGNADNSAEDDENYSGGVLKLSVLKMFWLETYLNGEKKETYEFTDGATNVADLGVGNITAGTGDNLQVIEATAREDFDEIRICQAGISASVFGGIGILYAYVGENPIIPAVNDCAESPISSEYFGTGAGYEKVGYKTIGWSSYAGVSLATLVDGDLENGIGIETFSSLFQPYMTVDFGRTVPAGSEVGFYITNGDLLNLSIAGTTEITTYDESLEQADNYTLTEIIGLKLIGGGQSYLSIKTTKPCRYIKIQFWGVTVKLGVTSVHYAFVREKTEVDVSSYFNLSDAVVYNPSYRFALPQGLPDGAWIEYNLIEWPPRASEGKEEDEIPQIIETVIGTGEEQVKDGSHSLINMNVAGDYVVEATYHGPNNETMKCQATITRLVKEIANCNITLTNPKEGDAIYKATALSGFDGIVVGGGSTDGLLSNVVDYDTNNFFENTNVNITLVQNDGIVRVEKIDGGIINPDFETTRVGFVISRSSPFLGADVLKFLRIKLLNGTETVFDGVGNENNGISLGLIQGGDISDGKACISVQTDDKFTAIELYYTGLLDLNLGHTLTVYYAYYENGAEACANPGEECMQLITNANYGAVATVELGQGVAVGSGVAGMANIVDDDITSYATIAQEVSVAGAFNVDVTFDRMKGGQEVGFIFSGFVGLAAINLIGVMTIEARLDGELVTTVNSSGQALGLKVAGYQDRQYVSITPPSEFDELILTWGGGVDALKNIKLYGLYLYPDYDGDGIVDCVSDEATTTVVGMYAEPADICEGDGATFRVDGGVEGAEYTLTFATEKHIESRAANPVKVKINSLGRLDFIDEPDYIAKLPADEYYVHITSAAGETEWYNTQLTVHPKETIWKGGTQGHEKDWDIWDNWTRGTPWDCTDVIIPSPNGSLTYKNGETSLPVTYYPKLTGAARCHNIHFEPGAELINQHYLSYNQAFVDAEFKVGGYQLVSAPLQSMVTGDMFIQESGRRDAWVAWRTEAGQVATISEETMEWPAHPNYFTVIGDNMATLAPNRSPYLEHRVYPTIYQRFWNMAVSNKSMSRAAYNTEEDPALSMTDWSRSFNAVSTVYGRAQGFALRISEDGGTGEYATFHFPKDFGIYNYYTSTGGETGTSDAVPLRNNVGKLMISGSLPNAITLYRELDSSGNLFLFGNPFMTHIDISALLNENEGIKSIKVFDGSRYVDITNDATTATSSITQIAPMEAVIVEAKEDGTGFNLNITSSMLEQKDESSSSIAAAPNQLRLTATSRGHSASCVVVPSSAASDDYDAREDATLLVGSEEGSGVAVYTVAGGKALSIQRMNQSGRIPVGFYLKEEGNVTLSFDPQGDAWRGWNLVDQQTGKRYPLDSETNLGTVKSGAGRFYLERTGN